MVLYFRFVFLDFTIAWVLAGDREENDEKIQAFRAAQLHTRQAQQFHEKANSLQEMLNLQSLHANVYIMPAYSTLLQEIDKLLGNALEEVTIIYLFFQYHSCTILQFHCTCFKPILIF